MTDKYNTIKTIRYMGNKNRLLDFIIPEIKKITKKNDVICDLMMGTCSISYALKNRNTIYCNDIQYYSYVIGKGIIENNEITTDSCKALTDIRPNYLKNKDEKIFNFFTNNFSDTYFSEEQCIDIDSIRYSIEKIENDYLKSLYLIALMFSMSKCESTTGHFAQYLPKEHKRCIPLRKKSIWDEFIKKCDEFKSLILSDKTNNAFNMDYKEFFASKYFNEVECFYIDTPYTGEQYSRFYHVLETVTKYDNPDLEFKGKYRKDRYMSDFSLRSNVKKEFQYMLNYLSENNKKVVLSYSNKALIPVDEMEFIFRKNFKHVKLVTIEYKHSTQGKGKTNLDEVVFVAYN